MKFACSIIIIILFSCKDAPIIYPDGGYAFINTDTIKDKSFPYFPVRDSFFSHDSIRVLLTEAKLMSLFGDENISLKASEREIFRLYVNSGLNPYYSFTLTNGKLIAKKGEYHRKKESINRNLTELEELQLNYLEVNFPLVNGTRKKPMSEKRRHFADSLLKLYPKMSDGNYYRYLFEKAYPIKNDEFSFTTKIITLSEKKYKQLIYKINNSGYWLLSLGLECNDGATDGIGFSLEANNGIKYNIVGSKICNATSNKFTQACQEIINYAHYEKEFRIDYNTSKDQ